jgi:DNA-binding NarL/FixJ family response regulator
MIMETVQPLLNVFILAHHSLLSGGVASTLSEYGSLLNVRLINSEAIDFPEIVQTESPAIIIMDAGDSDICKKTPVTQLLEWAPNAKIIRLDLSSDRIRIFSSIELQVDHAVDLVGLIQSLSKTELSI